MSPAEKLNAQKEFLVSLLTDEQFETYRQYMLETHNTVLIDDRLGGGTFDAGIVEIRYE